MKKKLFVVRHGQTLFNQKGRIQGWCDSPLTPLGHLQADAARQYLDQRGIDFDYAACSTLGRTEETIRHLTRLPYERVEGLKEFGYGQLEGEKSARYAMPKNENLETYYKKQGGESRSEVEQRMRHTVDDIMARPEVHNALLVSHGAASFRLANTIDPAKAKKLRKFNNCIIYEYDYEDGKYQLVDIIDEHVRDLKEPETKL